jgi:uncharacterized membrane protein HdeD (DUF308 family)
VERIRLSIDRRSARQRLADYLRREPGVADADAERRADEMVALLATDSVTGLGFGFARALVDNWWLFALRGLLALLFGIFAVVWPGPALATFVLVFGVWAFIDGIDALALAVTGWRSWQLALAGLVGIAIGLLTFFRPGVTAIGLYTAFAAWSIARGVLEIAVAIELRKEITGEWWLVLGGISSIVFGVLLVALPAAGILALAWLIGVYAIIFAFTMFVLSARLYRLRRPASAPAPRPVDVRHGQPA